MFIARGSQGQQAAMEGIALAIAIPLIPLFAYGPRHLTWIAEIYLIGVFRFYHQTLMTLTVREMAWAVRAKHEPGFTMIFTCPCDPRPCAFQGFRGLARRKFFLYACTIPIPKR